MTKYKDKNGVEKKRVDPLDRKVRKDQPMLAFCVCGKKLLPTTPEDVWAGIQPECTNCPAVL